MSQPIEDLNVKRSGEQGEPFVFVVPTAQDEIYPVYALNCPRVLLTLENGKASNTRRENYDMFGGGIGTWWYNSLEQNSSRLTNNVPLSTVNARSVV